MPDADDRSIPAEPEIEALTNRACRAAEQGDWDEVERCVIRRGHLLDQTGAAPVGTHHLVELDLHIQTLAMAARTAVGALLMELGQTRRNLRQLQQGNAGQESERTRLMNLTA
ncbi:MAG TPA: hypothetical protein VHF07_02460 [Nitrospiraceae bacterium]|nr:hypothetical protein [Nitrospiraceae bacterium]